MKMYEGLYKGWRRAGKVMKKALLFLQKLIEEYIPTIAFSMMFIAFNVQVFTRYVPNDPAVWPWDISLMGFLWTIMLGSIHGVRMHTHIDFDLVYVKVNDTGKLAFRLIGEVFLIVTLGIAILPSWDYIYFTRIVKSGALRIPMIYIFIPFMFFIVLSTLYLLLDLVRDIRIAVKQLKAAKGANV
jgi:TRAP-type C4-dicarboxylate transport system permease small subunit